MNIGYVRSGTEEEVRNQELEISSRESQKDKKIDGLMLLSDKDNLIATELLKLERNAKEVLILFDALEEKGYIFQVIRWNLINSNNLISRLLISLLASFEELERDLISKRTKEELKLKKESGVTLGRPKGTTGKSKLDGKEEEIQNFLNKDINKSTIAKLLNCDRSTLNNFIKSRNI